MSEIKKKGLIKAEPEEIFLVRHPQLTEDDIRKIMQGGQTPKSMKLKLPVRFTIKNFVMILPLPMLFIGIAPLAFNNDDLTPRLQLYTFLFSLLCGVGLWVFLYLQAKSEFLKLANFTVGEVVSSHSFVGKDNKPYMAIRYRYITLSDKKVYEMEEEIQCKKTVTQDFVLVAYLNNRSMVV